MNVDRDIMVCMMFWSLVISGHWIAALVFLVVQAVVFGAVKTLVQRAAQRPSPQRRLLCQARRMTRAERQNARTRRSGRSTFAAADYSASGFSGNANGSKCSAQSPEM